jgi:hypothetical protein
VLRGEDTLFASMTTYLHPRSAVLSFEWAVLHLPLEERAAIDYDKPFTHQAHLGLLANYLLSRIDTRGCGSAETRLSALAADIRGLAEWPEETLLAQVKLELAKDCAIALTLLENLLTDAESERHPAWRDFLARYGAQNREALMAASQTEGDQPDWLVPVRAAAIEFAQGLAAWSHIRPCSASVAAGLLDSDLLLP